MSNPTNTSLREALHQILDDFYDGVFIEDLPKTIDAIEALLTAKTTEALQGASEKPQPQEEVGGKQVGKQCEFTIAVSSHGTRRNYKVYVYPDLEKMYRATDRWHKRRGEATGEHNYHAITHSYSTIEYDKKGNEVNYPNVGIIRLCKGYLHSYIIAHEVAHAALNVYQLDCLDETDPVLDHIDPSNETFCHILSELEHNIVSKLHRTGAYVDTEGNGMVATNSEANISSTNPPKAGTSEVKG